MQLIYISMTVLNVIFHSNLLSQSSVNTKSQTETSPYKIWLQKGPIMPALDDHNR
jgi:hypothetical protein